MRCHTVCTALLGHRPTLFGAFMGAKHLDPSTLVHQAMHTGSSDQGLVFAPTVFYQWQGASDSLRVKRGRRMLPIAPHPWQQRRQSSPVVMGSSATPQCIRQQGFEVTRKRIGKHRAAFDQPRIAKAGGRPRLGAVHQHHLATAFLQLQRQAQAHNACAQNQHISGFVFHKPHYSLSLR